MQLPECPLYNYTDYKEYLKAAYSALKLKDKKYSHRFIAEQVGASSAGWFSNVVSGRIALTASYRLKLSQFLGHSAKESSYFELLVAYEQAGSIEEKRHLSQQLIDCRGVQSAHLSEQQFEFYRHWYISAIRELLLIYDFTDDYKALAQMVQPKITAKQAKQAIGILQDLQLIKPDYRGYQTPTSETIASNPTFALVHWADQMQSKGQLGVEAVSRFTRDERNISEAFAPLSAASYAEVVDDIETLRKKILRLSAEDTSANRIYQCNIQLFPMTNSISKES